MSNDSKVLALKYRPQNFDDLIGQDVVVETITNSIIANKVPNAYLFTGIRGVGKTTIARIVAKALNCSNGIENKCKVKCDNCDAITNSNHIDVLEMDAASRTGVDDVRELIEFSRYGPTSSKYKIFIIDEVHMLSKQAFNALLKTLEEPPEYLKFIFATTEIKKIPVTVISRCQRFDLSRIKSSELFSFINSIKDKEGGKITDEATLFIENNLKIKFIKGENLNNKITFKEDIETNKTYFGIGFDIHRLIRGKKLFLGGIKIPYHSGLKGHSDGDVIIHSIIDSLLGAMRKKDIGTFFPDNQKKYKNIRSPKMLKPIVEILYNNDFYINNLDINLICEQPKVSKYRYKIINSLSNLLDIDKELINLKGKTVEKLGLIGKEKAIACEVICSITQ